MEVIKEQEIITKENYIDHVNRIFKNSQEYLIENLPNINQLQRSLGCQQFININNICFNKVIDGARYFKKANINYYDSSIDNPDRTIMLAWENYLEYYSQKAINELKAYVDYTDKIYLKIVRKPLYQMSMMGNPIAARLLQKKNFYEHYYLREQSQPEKYNNIANALSEININNNLEDAIVHFLYNSNNVITKKYNFEEIDKNKVTEIKKEIFNTLVDNIVQSLYKLDRTEDIDDLYAFADFISNRIFENENNKQKKLSNK